MANLVPSPGLDPVYQIETTDLVLGGPGGVANLPAQNLLNLSSWMLRNALKIYPDTATAEAVLPNGQIFYVFDGVSKLVEYEIVAGVATLTGTQLDPHEVLNTSIMWEGSTNQKTINSSIVKFVNPKIFGAVGGGVADDTQAIIDMVAYINANDAVLYDWSGDAYNFTQNITVSNPNGKFTAFGNISFVSATSNFTFTGGLTQIGYVSTAAARNALTITLDTAAGLSANDIIIIENNRAFSFNAYRDYYHDGEYKEILSISGSDVTLKAPLETSYPGGVDDQVFKLEPIVLDIRGITFDCSGVQACKISLAARSVLDINAYNRNNITNASYGIIFDRVYSSKMISGRAVKLGLGNSGTDYGIVAANCQDLLIMADYSFGHRHACATGGSDISGAVPNRRVLFEKIKQENSPALGVHTADFHGNAVDCHYKNCTIFGMVGLGGERCYSINNQITNFKDETRPPIFATEVSGPVGSIGDYIHDAGAATSIMAWASSVTGAVNTKPYSFVLKDVKIGRANSLIGLMNATTLNNVASKFIIDGFEFLESFGTVTRLMTYTNLNASQVPSYVQITNPKNAIPDTMIIIAGDAGLAGVKKRIFGWNGSTANGSFSVKEDGSMTCRFRFTTTAAVDIAYAGGFKSANLTWTYPKAFQAAPQVTCMSGDNLLVAAKQAATPGTSSLSFFGMALQSSAGAGIVLDFIAEGRLLS